MEGERQRDRETGSRYSWNGETKNRKRICEMREEVKIKGIAARAVRCFKLSLTDWQIGLVSSRDEALRRNCAALKKRKRFVEEKRNWVRLPLRVSSLLIDSLSRRRKTNLHALTYFTTFSFYLFLSLLILRFFLFYLQPRVCAAANAFRDTERTRRDRAKENAL